MVEARRPLAWGRLLGLLVAGVAGGLALLLAYEATSLMVEIRQSLAARPLQLDVDWSRPGTWQTTFVQTADYFHGESLNLGVSPRLDASREQGGVFKRLEGQLRLRDPRGEELDAVPLKASRVHYPWPEAQDLMVTRLGHISVGEYKAVIEITSGEPKLAGRSQRLYVQYEACGLEGMTANVMALLAIPFGLVGLVASIAVLPGLWRYGLRRAA